MQRDSIFRRFKYAKIFLVAINFLILFFALYLAFVNTRQAVSPTVKYYPGLNAISGDSSNTCDEQKSLKKAKNCTFLVKANKDVHGSSFLINSEGYLVTNLHVVDWASSGYVEVWYNGKPYKSRIVGYSAEGDIAVIKLEAVKIQSDICEWYDSSRLGLAETVYAVGWPGSSVGESTITKGIYSRALQFEMGDDRIEMIQTDTSINPGNSGGPLVNKCGIVGINTSKLVWLQANLPSEGIGYAISSSYAASVAARIIQNDSGIAVVPEKSSLKSSSEIQRPNDPAGGIDPNQKAAYDYEKVKQWEQLRAQDGKIKDSWQGAGDSKYYNQEKLQKLLSALSRKIDIANKLWDGYINSKITYLQAYNLEFEYFTLQNEVALLTRDLNSKGKQNIYEDCVNYWKDLEKEYDKDFSDQIDKCEEYIE